MIIDTEWGGFGDRGEAEYILTPYDKIIDARSVHPGVQMCIEHKRVLNTYETTAASTRSSPACTWAR